MQNDDDICCTPIQRTHVQVAIDQKPLLSAMADNFEAAVEVSPEDEESKELLVQCSSVVLLDCSCGLPMYRAAMVIEPALPDDFAIRTTIQRSRVYYPSSAYQQGSVDQTTDTGSQSPTRLSEAQASGRHSTSGKSSLKPPKVQTWHTCHRRFVFWPENDWFTEKRPSFA